jgi:putative transposase
MNYTSGSHTVFHHRYHIVWITKYRYKVLEGALRERIRTIIRQVCKELGVQIVSGVLSREHDERAFHEHLNPSFPKNLPKKSTKLRLLLRSS